MKKFQDRTFLVQGRYKLDREIGAGSFGTVYLATDTRDKKLCAIKYERVEKDKHSLLQLEAEFYAHFHNLPGVATVYYVGVDNRDTIMVMELLGNNLTDVLKKSGVLPFPLFCNYAKQMIMILRNIHRKGFLHRDLKPENFMFGRDQNNQKLYLIDFGLATRITAKTKTGFVGNLRYSNISSLECRMQSPKNEMESLGYMLIFMLEGKQFFKVVSKDRVEQRKEHYRLKTRWRETMNPPTHPVMMAYMKYVYDPIVRDVDYDYLSSLFSK